MKLTKKKIFVMAIAISLIAILSFSTLAWFSDSKELTNNFMIADTQDNDPDDIFSVKLDETTPEGSGDNDGYVYNDILPGDELVKEPVVTNTGYYDQYIRVTVTVTDAGAWMTVLGKTAADDYPALSEIVSGYDANLWDCSVTRVSTSPSDDNLVYTLYYKKILSGEIVDAVTDLLPSNVTVFEKVLIPDGMTQAQAAAFDNQFDIKVKAEAVQTENVGVDSTNTVVDAVEAFAYVAANS